MYSTTKRTEAAIELINEFKTHDLTRKSSSEAVKPSRFKVTSKPPMPPTDPKTTPIPAPRNIKSNVGLTNKISNSIKMSGSSHIQSVPIGVEYRNCCRTLEVYLLFAILLGQIKSKLNYLLVNYKQDSS